MNLSKRWQWLTCVIAPTVLLVGVAVQRYNVEVHAQTPWTGGGFGMFSTVDVPGARMIRAYVLTEDGQALIMEPNLGEPTRLVYTQPKAARVQRAADYLAAQRWQVYEAVTYPAIRASLPAYFLLYLDRSSAWKQTLTDSTGHDPPYPERIAFDSRRAPPAAAAPASDVLVRGIRVEVWRPVFDRHAGRLVWTRIASATAEAPTP